MLHYQYIITALKINIYNDIVCFCLQTSEMYLKLTVCLSVKLSRNSFQKIIVARVYSDYSDF